MLLGHHHHQFNIYFVPKLIQGYGWLLPNSIKGRQPTSLAILEISRLVIATVPFREKCTS